MAFEELDISRFKLTKCYITVDSTPEFTQISLIISVSVLRHYKKKYVSRSAHLGVYNNVSHTINTTLVFAVSALTFGFNT